MAAGTYAKVFAQCKGTATSPDVTAITLAVADATVDDVAALVTAKLAAGDIKSTDLVTVLVGLHDVKTAYETDFDGSNEAVVTAALAAKGEKLAGLVNQMANAGARVLVSTIPDLGLSPYALKEGTDVGDDRPAVITRFVDAFNKSMRLALLNDGSKLGLLLADDLTRAMARVPEAYGLGNISEAACLATAVLPNCTTDTVIANAVDKSSTFLWADSYRPGAVFHLQLGIQATSRLNTLPF